MTWWQWLLDPVGLLLLLMLGYIASLVARRRWISRAGGTFECSVRLRHGGERRAWSLGVARYSGDVLEWFRIFALLPRPSRRWTRDSLSYVGRREREGPEENALYSDHVIVRCDGPTGPVEFAMSLTALTGFLAWLEASPPGRGRRPII